MYLYNQFCVYNHVTDTVFPMIVIQSARNLRFQASSKMILLQPLDFLKSRNLGAETFHFYFEISARGNCPEEAAIFFFQIFAYDYKRDLLHPIIVSLTLFVTFFPGIQSISLFFDVINRIFTVNMDFYANKYFT